MMPVWSQNHIKHQTFAALILSLRVLQHVWKPKKPKQCDCLSGSGYLPPLIPSRRPKALWRTQMLPHSFHRTTLPKRPGFTVSTAHWTHWRCPEEGKIRHELAVYLPFSIRKKQHGVILCLRRVIGCFLRRERDVTLRRLRKQQLHYKGRVIWLQTPLLHVSQRDSESNDGMTTALFSLLVQDDVKLNDLYLCS